MSETLIITTEKVILNKTEEIDKFDIEALTILLKKLKRDDNRIRLEKLINTLNKLKENGFISIDEFKKLIQDINEKIYHYNNNQPSNRGNNQILRNCR